MAADFVPVAQVGQHRLDSGRKAAATETILCIGQTIKQTPGHLKPEHKTEHRTEHGGEIDTGRLGFEQSSTILLKNSS
jgi:hypothetical protein